MKLPFSSWRSFRRSLGHRAAAEPKRKRSRRRHVIESLEIRQLLTTVTVSSSQAVESSTGTMSFTITVSGAAPNAPIYYGTSDGTGTGPQAHAGVDYIQLGPVGTTANASGAANIPVSVSLRDDGSADESNGSSIGETFFMNVSVAGSGAYTATTAIGTGTIWETAPPLPAVSISGGGSATEPTGTNTAFVTFTVSVSPTPTASVSVNYNTQDDGATYGIDYVSAAGVATFTAGQTSADYITVRVLDDKLAPETNSPEDFFVTLSAPSGATLGTSSATGYVNEDTEPVLSISGTTVTEPTSGGVTTAIFTVSVSPAPDSNVTVDYSTGDDSAKQGTDYVSASGVLSFAPGQTSATIAVQVKDDMLAPEIYAPEDFYITLTNPSGATFGTSKATAYINEDAEPVLSISGDTVTEPTSGGVTLATFTVSVSPVPDTNVTVRFNTVDGSATQGIDYVSTSGALVFAPGQTSAETITVQVKDDILADSSPQDFYVTLTNPAGATFGTSSATGTINEDTEPSLTISGGSATEPTSGTTYVTFTVTASPTPDTAVSVDFNTQDGSATKGIDYVSSSGALSFSAGQTSPDYITVQVLDDNAVSESAQQFTVLLSNPVGAALGTPSQATGTINEDQEPTVSVSDAEAPEQPPPNSSQSSLTFTLSLSAPSNVPVTVSYQTQDAPGETDARADYASVVSSVVIPASQTEAIVTVPVYDDGDDPNLNQDANSSAATEPTTTMSLVITAVVAAAVGRSVGIGKINDNPDNQPSYCPCTCGCGNAEASVNPPDGGMTGLAGGTGNGATKQAQSLTPHPIVWADQPLSANVSQATDIMVQFTFGTLPAQTVYYSPAGYAQGETVRFAQQFDAGSLSSGRYQWTVTITEEYSNPSLNVTNTYSGDYNLQNLDNSPFGAGWMLHALDQLDLQKDGNGNVLGANLADGSGNMYWFASNGSGGFFSPANAPGFATLATVTSSGTITGYTLTDKQGNVENFDANGQLVSKVDLNGNKTSFAFSGTQLQTITDPEGRNTTFTYTTYTDPSNNPHSMVSSVTDIDGRTTTYTYTYVAGAYRLASITRPNPGDGEAQSTTTFGYDATTGLETSMTNADGTTTYSYNAFRGVSQVTSPDGTKTDYTAPLTAALVDTSGGNGTQAHPASLVNAAAIVGTVTVENYNPITSVTTLQTTTYTTGLNGEVTSSTDPLGNTTTTKYNAAGEPLEIDAPALSSGPYAGQPNVTKFTYDANGNLIEETLPDGSTESWTYDPTWNEPTSFTDPLGRVTDYSIDPSNGNVLSMTEVGASGQPNRTTSYTYTPAPTTTGQVPGGLVATETDPRGLETSYAYNTHGMVTATTYAVGTTDQASVSYTYDSQDNLKTETDELGRTTTYGYDGLGRQIEVDAPAPNAAQPSLFLKTTYVYDALGRKTSETVDNYNPLTSATTAATTNYYYEATGDENAQVTKVVQPDLTTLTYLYDGADNLLKETDALGRVTEYQYDADNRQIAQQAPSPVDSSNNGTFNRGTANGPVTTVQYDALGNVIAQIDANGNETDNVYDLRGNLLSTTGAAAASGGVRPITSYSYDADQEVVSQSDALGRLTYFQYDPFGEMTLRQDPSPDGGKSPAPTTTYQYDADGNQTLQIDPLSNQTTSVYDNRNRLIERIDPSPDGTQASPTMTYSYDAAGEVTKTVDAKSRVTEYAYDGAGNLTATIAPNLATGGAGDASTTTADLYDMEGNKVRETDPQGNATTYAYDIMNRLTSVTQPAVAGQSPVTSYQYDADGEVTKTIDPLLRTYTESYDGLGRVSGEVDFTGVTTSYSYDLLSQMVHSVETGGTLTAGATTNVYDNLGRLTSTTDAKGGVTKFGYDLVGNRTSLTDSVGNTSSWQFDGLNRVTEESLPTNGTRTYQYDANGNLVQATDANGRIIQYQYDHLNRQTTETWLAATAVVSTLNDTVQKVVLPAGTNGGLWELAYGETSITAINYNANAAQVQAAIEGITTASGSHPLAGRVSVTGSGSSVDPFVIQFTGATTDTAEPVLTAIFTGLTGGSNYDPNNSGLFLTTAPAAGYNQQQVVGYVATGSSAVTQGNFTLSFGGDTTAALPYNATPQQVQTALAGLASIGSGHVTVNGPSAGQIGATGVDLYTVTFTDLLGGEAGLPAITIQSQGLADSLGQTSDVQTESWIVAPPAQASGVMQQVVVTAPAGGTFDLSFKGDATGALAQGISAAQLQTALAALASVGSGNVLVAGSGTALDPYLISFIGTLAGQELPALQVVGTPTTVNTATTNYDAASQTTSVGDNFSHYAYTYDGQGNLASVDNTGTPGGQNVVLTSQYDSLGNRTSLSASIGGAADFINNYSYDALSQLTQLTQQQQSGGNAVAPKGLQFTYDPLGDLKTIQRYTNLTSGPNSATDPADSTLGYNTLGQLASIAHSHNASPLDNLAWTYDALGRVATFTSSVDGTATYGYDLTNQATSATYTTNPGAHQPPNESYGYDANGNRTSSGTATVTSAPPNEVASDGTFNYTYDAEGNRITKTGIAGGPAAGESTTYSWDYRNRLTEVESFNSGTLTQAVAYSYDVFDHMIEREVDSTGAVDASGHPVFSLVQNFVYDGNDIALEFDNGSLAHRYLSAPGANGVDAVMAEEAVSSTTSPGAVTWPLTDNLGSVRDVVDSTGALLDHVVYNSFGLVAYESASVHHLQGYAGGLTDAATGLVNFWHRWYDPTTGGWTNADSDGFSAGDPNLMRYVGNDPLDDVDPTGLAKKNGKYSPWMWNWHHLLPRAVFNEDFMQNHGLNLCIDDAEFGWMLRAKDHSNIHPEWNRDWSDWIEDQEEKGIKITKQKIKDQMTKMIEQYNLKQLGFAAEACHARAKEAYKAAERLARTRAAREAATKLAEKMSGKMAGKALKKAGSVGRKAVGAIPGVGVVVGTMVGVAMGEDTDTAFIDSAEPLGLDANTTSGGPGAWLLDEAPPWWSELRQEYDDQLNCQVWQEYQNKLESQWKAGLFLGPNNDSDASGLLSRFGVGGSKGGTGEAPSSHVPPPDSPK